jgi:hypothetical protein
MSGETEENHEDLRIGGLYAEIRVRDLKNIKQDYQLLDRGSAYIKNAHKYLK